MGKRKSAMLVFRILEILKNYATKDKPMKLMQILRRLDADYTETIDRGTLKVFFASPFCRKLQNKNVGCCKTVL